MIAVVMAGGYGSRIASVNRSVPKPMIEILGKTILEYQISCLAAQGIRELVFVVGYLHQVIQDRFGDGQRFGVHISYIVEDSPLGTAGALYFLKDRIEGDFLLINGDIIFDIDIMRFWKQHKRCGGIATIFTHPNNHPYDSAVVSTGRGGKVTGWLNKEDERSWYQNQVNAGIHMFSRELFSWMERKGMLRGPERLDLDRDVLRPMVGEGILYAYSSPEYVKDMGTPERLKAVEEDLKENRVSARNLSMSQKAVFLDRDGTINEYVGFLKNIDDLRLKEGAAKAIRRLNEAGWLVIVVTNQPVIARGEITAEELKLIHDKMETLLGKEGAYVDAIYHCPHHPDGGFAGERPEYKRICDCRKPKPGMLIEAAKRFHIDLSSSWIAGDQETDIRAGENAGCHTAGVYGCKGEKTFRDLPEFSAFLCGGLDGGYREGRRVSG